MENELLRTNNCVFDIDITVDRYADMVFRIALLYLKNKADAQDATQEVFLKLLRKNTGFEKEEHQKAWLITVTVNYCKDQLKSAFRRKAVPLLESVPDVSCIQEQDKREVAAAVFALPLKYRNVIYLYYYEGYSTAELAKMLGSKEATVRTRLKRGRELLKTQLGGLEL